MPAYDYICENGHEFTVDQRITEEALKTCGQWGCDAPCKRLISRTSFVLKGGGWSATNYGK